ncbi:MAG: hypothetical protein ABEI77_01650 [Halorientalis sp.]
MDEPNASTLAAMDSDALTAALYRHLKATEQRPLDTRTNRWLGEAQAVAADIATSDVSPAVASDRAAIIVDLLDRAGTVDDSDASRHVATSRALAVELRDRR